MRNPPLIRQWRRFAALIALAAIGTLGAGQSAFAQSQTDMAAGAAFANSIAPTSASQVVNPSGVSAAAWNSTTTPTAVPTGLGGFSAPTTSGATVYNSAITGGLTSLGTQAQVDCANFVPGNDPDQNEACAAVNFLNDNCFVPTAQETAILGSTGVGTLATSASCAGTLGAGQAQNQVNLSPTDPLFSAITNISNEVQAAAPQSCTTSTVVTAPAQFEQSNCTKSVAYTEVTCSQYLSEALVTTESAATQTDSCTGGTLQNGYCVASSTSSGTVNYVCPTGYSVSGTTCVETVTSAATPNTYIFFFMIGPPLKFLTTF